MQLQEHILSLVSHALDALEDNTVPLSATVRKCIRVARLRNDFVNLLWLLWETVNFADQDHRISVLDDMLVHLSKEQYAHYSKKFGEAWIHERECASVTDKLEVVFEDNILPKPVSEIELDCERFSRQTAETATPQGLHPHDLFFVNESNTRSRTISRVLEASYRSILERIRNRVHDFLSQTEKQLLFGQIHADIFEQNRLYVEVRLGQLCPDALAQFTSAYRHTHSNDPESSAQALLSCRRLLKSLADVLYPPRDEPAIGSDGQMHELRDERYIARLRQFVFEQTARATSGQLLQAQVQDLGSRLDRLYDLMNKGLHDWVDQFEFNQCLIQTYLVVGDLLRIADKVSAVDMEETALAEAVADNGAT